MGFWTDVPYDHPLDTCTSNTCILDQLCISLRNILVESHLVAPALAKIWFSALNWSYFAKFKYILMQPHRSEFGASWSQYCQTIGTVISDVIFKTGSVRFSMCHLIFWPNFSIIDQHLVLVLCNLHVFLTNFTALYGWNNLFFRYVMLQMGLIYPQLLLKHMQN